MASLQDIVLRMLPKEDQISSRVMILSLVMQKSGRQMQKELDTLLRIRHRNELLLSINQGKDERHHTVMLLL